MDTRGEADSHDGPEGAAPAPVPVPAPPELVLLDAAAARRVWLVRAFETWDREGTLVPHPVRSRASRRAREALAELAQVGDGRESGSADDPGPFLARRASELADFLEHRVPSVRTALRLVRWPATFTGLLSTLALLVGFSLNALGPSQKIHIFFFPLVGLVFWNLGVYLVLGIAALRSSSGSGLLPALFARGVAWLSSPKRPWLGVPELVSDRAARERVFEALTSFVAGWSRIARPLYDARVRLTFHSAAACLVLGVVGGMYVRGLALNYQATWESTFLDREDAQNLLDAVFAPAASVIGEDVPELPPESELSDADVWVHLYAVTVLALVIVPRVLLALVALRRARRLARRLAVPIDDVYFTRLLSADRGEGLLADVLPYSFALSPRACETLSGFLLDLLGNRATIRLSETVPYGAEGVHPDGSAAHGMREAVCRVLVFNLAQSPEREVHGEFLEELKELTERRGAPACLLVVLEESGYKKRMGEATDAAGRVAGRRRAWQRLTEESGVIAVPLDLEESPQERSLAHLRAALWPRATASRPVPVPAR